VHVQVHESSFGCNVDLSWLDIGTRALRNDHREFYCKSAMVLLREADASHDGSGLSLLQQMQLAQKQASVRKDNAAIALVVFHVQSLMRANRGKLRDVFLNMDHDGGGSIDIDEFRQGLMHLGIELQEEEVAGVFSMIDTSGDGDVSLREFMAALAKPLKPLRIAFNDFFEGIRKIGVYMERAHAIAVYEHVQMKEGVVNTVKLEKLLNDPPLMLQLHPSGQDSGHSQKNSNGIPKPVQSKSFRFSSGALSSLAEQKKQAQEQHNRDLLHRTVRRVELKFVNAAFFKWASVAFTDSFKLKRTAKKNSLLAHGQKKEEIVEDLRTAEDLKTEEDYDNEAVSFGDGFAAHENRKLAAQRRKEKQRKRKLLLENVQRHIETIPRPHWNSSALWPYRYKNMDVEKIPPLAKMFKQNSYWNKHCNPKPAQPPDHKIFRALGERQPQMSPRRPRKNAPSASHGRPSPRSERGAAKISETIAPVSTRHTVAFVKKRTIGNIWKPPPRPAGHTVSEAYNPLPNSVDLDDPASRLDHFDKTFASSNEYYNKLLRFVSNRTPITYPKIDYDVLDEDQKIPHTIAVVKKTSQSLVAGTKRLKEMKERRKALKLAESERKIAQMGEDAKAALRQMHGTL
jgi:hypothetical protein